MLILDLTLFLYKRLFKMHKAPCKCTQNSKEFQPLQISFLLPGMKERCNCFVLKGCSIISGPCLCGWVGSDLITNAMNIGKTISYPKLSPPPAFQRSRYTYKSTYLLIDLLNNCPNSIGSCGFFKESAI